MLTMAEQQQQHKSVQSTSIETTKTTTGPTLIPDNEAHRSAVAALSDQSLRVPCYCEENVWRSACRKMHQCDTSASVNGQSGVTNGTVNGTTTGSGIPKEICQEGDVTDEGEEQE